MAEVAPTTFMQDQLAALAMQPAMAYLAAREMTSFMAVKSKMSCVVMAISRASKFQTIPAMMSYMEATAMT